MTSSRRLPAAVAVLGIAHVAVLVAVDGVDIGLQRGIRVTPRYTAMLLFLTMSASSWARLAPGAATAAWLRHRRGLGLATATAHGVHLATILTSWFLRPAFRALVDPVASVPGAAVSMMAGVLALTSNDRALRRLGPARWKLLHRVGVWLLWVAFVLNYGGKVEAHPGYWTLLLPLLTVPVLRLAAARS